MFLISEKKIPTLSMSDPVMSILFNRKKRNTEQHAHEDHIRPEESATTTENSVTSTSTATHTSTNVTDDQDYSYLDYLIYDDVLELEDDGSGADNEADEDGGGKIVYRDFPMEDGYVRIPIQFPGLNLTRIEAPSPKLWTAEAKFKEQVIRN